MRLFGRRWAVATDDAPLLAAPTAAFQLGWAACLAGALALGVRAEAGCAAGVYAPYLAALGGLLACALVGAAASVWLTAEGLKGRRRRGEGLCVDWRSAAAGEEGSRRSNNQQKKNIRLHP
jgi:hypothetical protein